MDSVARSLRQTRERLGYGLEEVSRHLNIRLPHLQAIEAGEFGSLPGRPYAVGFVRSYAGFLGLDGERAVELLKSEIQTLSPPHRLVFPSPAPEGRVPGGAIMLVAGLLVVLTYAGWYYLDRSGHGAASLVPEIPPSLQFWLETGDDSAAAVGESPPELAVAPDGVASETLAGQPPAEPEPARIDVGTAPAGPPQDTASTAAPPPAVGDTGPVAAPPERQTGLTPPVETAEPAPVAASAGDGATDGSAAADLTVAAPAAEPTDGAATQPEPAQAVAPAPVAAAAGDVGSSAGDAAPAASAIVDDAEPAARPPAIAPDDAGAANSAEAEVLDDTILPETPGRPTDDNAKTAPAIIDPIQPASAGGAPGESPRVVIRASDDSWVRVRAADSTTLMARIMHAGEVYEVPNQQGLRMTTGNAGALTIVVDGREGGRLGEPGEVIRNIDLDPARLLPPGN